MRPPPLATLGDAAELLLEPGAVERHNHALLSRSGFATRYAERGPLLPVPPADAPAGSLARTLIEFMAWYELEPGFFPSDPQALAAMDPTEFAAHMLAVYHDVLHVLTGHDTSDHDEVAIQSFMLGQAPIAFARFIANVAAAPDLASALRYKHLRDLLGSPIDPAAWARGRAARPLLELRFESLWTEPLASLRDQLEITPRTSADLRPAPQTSADLRPAPQTDRPLDASINTCGGRSAPYFFSAAGGRLDSSAAGHDFH